jgi:hypothetical protein
MECNLISENWLGGSVIVLAVTTVGRKSSYDRHLAFPKHAIHLPDRNKRDLEVVTILWDIGVLSTDSVWDITLSCNTIATYIR